MPNIHVVISMSIFFFFFAFRQNVQFGKLYNYADDNTLSFSCPDFGNLMKCLVEDSKILIDWFDINCIKGVGEGGGRGGGGARASPLSKVGGHKWVCAPPLLGRANVLISLFAHILW